MRAKQRLVLFGCVLVASISFYISFGKLLPLSGAASGTITTVEAEAAAWSPAGSTNVVLDTKASGGKAIKVTKATVGTMTVQLSSAAAQINIMARGDQCEGAPIMQVKLDGKILGSQNITSPLWTQYGFPISVGAGSHTLEIASADPYKATFMIWTTCQRSAYIDSASFMNTASVSQQSSSPQTSSSPSVATPSTSVSTLQGGYSTHTANQSDMAAYLKFASNGGAKYIRDDISWAQMESTKGTYNYGAADAIVRAAARQGLRVLMIADTAPQWASGSSNFWTPPTSAADYGNFITQVVKRYGTNGTFWTANPTLPKLVPVGIEIWNEPNGVIFWGGQTPDPAKYVQLLKAGYTAAKAVDASIPIISGGLGSGSGYNDINCDGNADSGQDGTGMTGINYLEDMYKNGAAGYMDAVGWHSYIFGQATAAQMMVTHACSGWSLMQDTSPSLRSFMTQYGDSAKKIWITETGYPTCTSTYTTICLSEAEQGKLAAAQAAAFKTYSWAGLYFWYDLTDDTTTTFEYEKHMGALHSDGTPKPAYTALKAAFTGS